jgi:hypothetical protein
LIRFPLRPLLASNISAVPKDCNASEEFSETPEEAVRFPLLLVDAAEPLGDEVLEVEAVDPFDALVEPDEPAEFDELVEPDAELDALEELVLLAGGGGRNELLAGPNPMLAA